MYTESVCQGIPAQASRMFSPEFVGYTLPEIATVSINSGMTFLLTDCADADVIKNTPALSEMQMDTEVFFGQLSRLEDRDVIIFSNRGVCDKFSYCFS